MLIYIETFTVEKIYESIRIVLNISRALAKQFSSKEIHWSLVEVIIPRVSGMHGIQLQCQGQFQS